MRKLSRTSRIVVQAKDSMLVEASINGEAHAARLQEGFSSRLDVELFEQAVEYSDLRFVPLAAKTLPGTEGDN